MATVSEMVDELAHALGDPGGKVFTKTIIRRYLTRAQERIAADTLCHVQTQIIDLSDDANRYSLQDGFLKEYLVTFRDSNDSTAKFKPIVRTAAVGDTSSFNNQKFYYIEVPLTSGSGLSTEIVLWPSKVDVLYDASTHTANGNSLKVVYASLPTTSVISGGMLDLPSFTHEAIHYEALARLALIPGKLDPNVAMAYRQQAERELRGVRRRFASSRGRSGIPSLAHF